MPVGPWYVVAETFKRSRNAGSEANPVSGTGSVYRTSAKNAPSSATRSMCSSSITRMTRPQNARQRRCGSGPAMKARLRAAESSQLGHCMCRICWSSSRTSGRWTVKSKNSSPSIEANFWAPSCAATYCTALVAADPASLHPENATSSVRGLARSGRDSMVRASTAGILMGSGLSATPAI